MYYSFILLCISFPFFLLTSNTIYCSRIKFIDYPNMYLTLNKLDDTFSIYSLARISQMTNLYCYNPYIQNIDENFIKIWYCGRKICYDEKYKLYMCDNEERRTTLKLVKVNKNLNDNNNNKLHGDNNGNKLHDNNSSNDNNDKNDKNLHDNDDNLNDNNDNNDNKLHDNSKYTYDNGLYTIEIDGKCFTIKSNRLVMEDCGNNKINKVVTIENVDERFISNDSLKIKEEQMKEENYYKQASIDSN